MGSFVHRRKANAQRLFTKNDTRKNEDKEITLVKFTAS